MAKAAERFKLSSVKIECAERLTRCGESLPQEVDLFFATLRDFFKVDSAEAVSRKQAEEAGIEGDYERRVELRADRANGAVRLLDGARSYTNLFLFPPSSIEHNMGVGMVSKIVGTAFLNAYVFDLLQARLDPRMQSKLFPHRFYCFRPFDLKTPADKSFYVSAFEQVARTGAVYEGFVAMERQERLKLEKIAEAAWESALKKPIAL